MTSGVAAAERRAAIGEAGALEAEVVAAGGKPKKPGFWRKLGRVCLFFVPKPKSADGWTNTMAIIAMVFIPAWFYLAHKWNPGYEPIRPWVWGVAWKASMYWMCIQMLFLSVSIQKTADEIRFREIIIAFLPILACAVTLTGQVILWSVNLYSLGAFQVDMMWSFLTASTFNAIIGGGVRFALKGKMFGQLGTVQ